MNGWSADFHPGQITALTGPSGSGKSTRLFILGLLLQLTNGAVELDGQNVSRLSDGERSALRAHRFGFIFQDASLDPTRTVLANVLESCVYRGEQGASRESHALALMEQLGVTVPPRRRPGEVSGGQAQRIAACRALLAEPDVVLADEPTGNLDRASADGLLQALSDHRDRGGCIVIVTHDERIAAWADSHLVVMS